MVIALPTAGLASGVEGARLRLDDVTGCRPRRSRSRQLHRKKAARQKAAAPSREAAPQAAARAAAAATPHRAARTPTSARSRGVIVSLTPLQVGDLTCAVPAGVSLAGFVVGQTVEITCDLVAGVWTLRKIKREDGE